MKLSGRPKIDFLILTSLLEEFGAVVDSFYHDSKLGTLQFPTRNNQARMVKIGNRGDSITGIIACSNSMGASDAAIISSYLLSIYNFKIVVLAGIAGGVLNSSGELGLHLGDVVLSNAIMEANDVRTYSNRQFSCLLYTSPSPRDQRGSRMPSSA